MEEEVADPSADLLELDYVLVEAVVLLVADLLEVAMVESLKEDPKDRLELK